MTKVIIPDSFPNLPSAMQKIQKMFAIDDINMRQLVSLLEEEPLLCANILKLVNSSYYGLQNKVASVNQAVMLLGSTVIRGIAMATVLKKSFPLDLSPYGISIEFFDKICVLRVRLLKEWLKDENIDMRTLTAAAFLMESGKIVTSYEIKKNALSEIFKDLRENSSLLEAENVLFATDSYQIAALLFRQWQFEDAFTELIGGIYKTITDEQKILFVLSTAINIEGILEDASIQKSLELIDKYGFNKTTFEKAIQTIKKELS